MAIAFIASNSGGGSDTGFSNQAPLDSTGADFLVALLVSFLGPNISDSKGNSWTAITPTGQADDPEITLYYSIPSTVGTSHTLSSSALYSAVSWAAFSGVLQASPAEGAYTYNDVTGASAQPGAILPSENGSIWITGYGGRATTPGASIDAPFTADVGYLFEFGNSYAVGIGWDIQTTATSRDPTWTPPSSTRNVVMGQVFKPAGGGGGATCPGYIAPFGWN